MNQNKRSNHHSFLSKFFPILVALCFLSAGLPVRAAEWLNQDFSSHAIGDLLGTNNNTAVLTSVSSNNVVVDVSGNKKVRYSKATSASGGGTLFKLSDNLSNDRPQGYFSFKSTIATSGSNSTGSSYLMYVLGANDTNLMANAGSHYLQIRIYNANPAANQLRIYSGSGNTNNPTLVWPTSGYLTIPTTENSFQVWYNKTASPMSYTNPSGVSNQLSANSFVVYINGTLYGSNASSTGALPSTVSSLSVSGGVTNTNSMSSIGKLGWWPGVSTQPYDVTFDDVYAADTAPSGLAKPTIISATNAVAYQNIPFSYQIVTDPPGATSFSASGSLPDGLSLDTSTGLISGVPTTLGGPTVVSLTASNSAGVSKPINLAITVGPPINSFSGSSTSLNSGIWSLGSTPTASANSGSFTDLILNSSATNLTTTSGNVYGKSWNVTNGGNYTVSSVAVTTGTSFKLGNNNPASSTFDNYVSGIANDLVYLTNGSKLTFLGTNPSGTEGTVDLKNAGNLNIASNSILEIGAVLSGSGTSYGITKTGGGILILSRSNSFRGTTTLSEGTLRVSHPDALSTNGANVTLTGGILENTTNFDLGRTFTTPTTVNGVTFDKVDGLSTYLQGAATLKPTDTNTLTLFKIVGRSVGDPYTVTKSGTGTLWLRGGSPTGFDIGSWRVEQGTLLLGTTASGALGTNGLTMAGGDVRFSKGIGSSGTYSGQGLDVPLVVSANTTMTLDANPAAPVGANTVTFPSLTIGNQVIHVVKSATANSSQTPGGYTDPSIGFRSATLNGAATFDAGALTAIILQGATGSGGLTKTGTGRLTLSNLTPQATATATLAGDGVGAIAVVGGGSNYASVPAVTITRAASDTTGSGATASATLVNGVVTAVTVDNPGTGYTATPTVTIAAAPAILNSYTGNTTIGGGTLGLSGNLASSITIQNGAVLEVALNATNSTATTTGTLALDSGSLVKVTGTPATGTTYTLVTAASISGTPVLSSSITGFSLVKSGNSLVLQPASASSGFDSWLAAYPSLTGASAARTADPDQDGMSNQDEYAFGTSPTSAGSRTLTSVDTGTSGQVTLKWLQRSDVTYTVKSTSDLSAGFSYTENGAADSSPQPTGLPSGYTQRQITINTDGTRKFIRVQAVVP